METQVPDSISVPAASRGQGRSPTKSPVKTQSQPVNHGWQDDVGRDRTNDQRAAVQPTQPASAQKPNKYLQLLNVAYPIKPKLPASTESAAPAAAVSPSPASQPPTNTAKPTAAVRSNVTSFLRSSGSALQGMAAKANPAVRPSRSKASILDPSAGGSMIPASPGAAASTALSPGGGVSRAAAASADVSFLARRSMPAAAARPQYAFGSRIDPNPTRKPSPARRSVPGPQADHSRASPQRVPSAARSTSSSGLARNASAPRTAGADKVQSRFTMHQANAVAEQRSKTPNPAARGRTSAATAASPSVLPASDMRPAAAQSSAAGKHIARLRASQEGLANKLPGFSATRSASPSTRAAARSVPAAGSAGSRTAGPGTVGASPVAKQFIVHAAQRTPGSRLERPTSAASLVSSKTGKAATMGVPTIQDRYKSGYKHTPAAAAVAEARAAAAAASPAAAAVPKLSLGALLSSPDNSVLLFTRNRECETSGSPKAQAQQRSIPKLGLTAAAQRDHDSQPAASPFLGRMAGFAELNGAMAEQQSPAFYTPQQRHVLPLHVAAAVPAASPANTVYYTPVRAEESMQTPAAARSITRIQTADSSCTTPPLLHRSLSSTSAPGSADLFNDVSREMLSRFGSRQLEGQSSIPAGLLSTETSALSMDSAVAVAAKGLMLPLHKLQESPSEFASPPKHRRGDCGSPKGAAAVCSELLKRKASDICNGLTAAADAAAAAAAEDTTATAVAVETAVPTSAPATKSPIKARKQTPASAGHNASRVPSLARRSIGSVIDSVERHAKGHSAAAGFATPKANTGLMNGVTGSTGKSTPSSSIGDKMRMTVPRLDLTPVLTQMHEIELATHEADAAAAQQQQPLALEYHGAEEPADVADAEQEHGRKTRSGREGRPASAGSGARRGTSSSSRGGACAGGSNRTSSAPEQQPAQQEAFYVYEAVMPTEETRTYEELRRALLKCPGGQKLAANLQGLWGCYHDARKATEAMAFRGHRLLDQVSNEYCSYKRHAEEQLQQLQHERDNLQLALVNGDGDGSLEVSDKDQQVKSLRQENEELRLQLAEMEKAMQQAADYHFSQQADQVHVKARTIAQSDTTNILFQKTMEQQQELQRCQLSLEEMTAAMKLAAGALAATNYMDPSGPVRTMLPLDTLAVLDGLIHSTAAEGGMIDSLLQGAGATLPHVHIEELPS